MGRSKELIHNLSPIRGLKDENNNKVDTTHQQDVELVRNFVDTLHDASLLNDLKENSGIVDKEQQSSELNSLFESNDIIRTSSQSSEDVELVEEIKKKERPMRASARIALNRLFATSDRQPGTSALKNIIDSKPTRRKRKTVTKDDLEDAQRPKKMKKKQKPALNLSNENQLLDEVNSLQSFPNKSEISNKENISTLLLSTEEVQDKSEINDEIEDVKRPKKKKKSTLNKSDEFPVIEQENQPVNKINTPQPSPTKTEINKENDTITLVLTEDIEEKSVPFKKRRPFSSILNSHNAISYEEAIKDVNNPLFLDMSCQSDWKETSTIIETPGRNNSNQKDNKEKLLTPSPIVLPQLSPFITNLPTNINHEKVDFASIEFFQHLIDGNEHLLIPTFDNEVPVVDENKNPNDDSFSLTVVREAEQLLNSVESPKKRKELNATPQKSNGDVFEFKKRKLDFEQQQQSEKESDHDSGDDEEEKVEDENDHSTDKITKHIVIIFFNKLKTFFFQMNIIQ
jgi:hypothetical protein